jgi:hypothetical protein
VMYARLLAAFIFIFSQQSYGGPPEGSQNLMIPYPSICTPGMEEMMSALTTDYAVHISMTFEESPVTGVVIVHNPDTKSAAILHVSESRTCLVFSGQYLQMFERPEGMAPPQVELEEFKES